MKSDFEFITLAHCPPLKILRATKTAGERKLLADGFLRCPNPNWLRKGDELARFNRYIGGWVFENAPLS